ncbi:cbb3-type cytochrome oxidase assembly protein CcoS [Roseovarius arcticus]|uniref:cbb3-type cytochrome oxidase assembly protein CcoS n=1 Tax=Roseovarius arcticus TaxID=2547404 RepID=UPI001110F9FD|nr:cbb3-type cytochrome oxidase assembly protein CcoS [Roseovarius arcticus]
MNILLILIPVSITLGALGLCAFLWTIRSGQYDDAEGAAARMLLDDDEPAGTDQSRTQD